jgi:hypothetical protein
MSRRLIPFLVAIAAIIAACGGASSAPALTDPKEILSKTAASLSDVKTVHIKAELAGKVDPSIATGGTGSGGAQFDLTGSTLEGDLDIKGSQAKVTASVPALLSFAAELIATGGNAYLKTSLTGDKYQKLDAGALTGGLPLPSLPTSASPDPSAAAAMLDQLKTELDKLPAPVKLDDAKCGDQDCYHVQLKISSTDIPDASALPSGLAGAVTVDIYSRKSDYRPARLVISVDGGTQGNLTATVDLSNYDAAVTVSAPPADQISDQPFSLPGLTP